MKKRKSRVSGFKAEDALQPAMAVGVGLVAALGSDYAATKLPESVNPDYVKYGRIAAGLAAAIFTPAKYRHFGIAAGVGLAAAPIKSLLTDAGIFGYDNQANALAGYDNQANALAGYDNQANALAGYANHSQVQSPSFQDSEVMTD